MTELAVSPMRFDGATYDHARDSGRLGDQMASVFAKMKDGHWWTLHNLAVAVDAPQSSVSARIRDLRKERFGGHGIERSYTGRGIWVYRLIVRGEAV